MVRRKVSSSLVSKAQLTRHPHIKKKTMPVQLYSETL